MKHIKMLTMAFSGFVCAASAVGDGEFAARNSEYPNSQYNVVDDLDDYNQDYRWPEQAAEDQDGTLAGNADDMDGTQSRGVRADP